MPACLILGASRGLGLGLARELGSRGWAVTASVRNVQDRAALEATGASAVLADITDPASLAALAPTLPKLDLLFVNAGISEPGDVAAIDEPGIAHLFLTNAVAPIRAAEALLGCLAPGGTVAFMSSRMGSVALTTADNKAMYRASKAALNSLTRALASRIGDAHPVLSLHPGWVATDMGGAGADLDVPTSVRGLADVIEARRGRPGSAFLDYSGAELAW